MRQPDDPGIPEGEEFERLARLVNRKKTRDRWRYWSLVLAAGLIVMLVVLASRPAAAQDPPVPLEEPCPAGNCVVYNQAHIYAFTGDERTIRWSLVQSDVDSMALFTELQVFEFPPPTRAGTYFVEARACRTDPPDPADPDAEPHPDHGVILCSIIASSTDPTYTDPDVYPRGFVMLIKIPPATGGGIE
jgi:hypothetical protein